MTKPSTTNPTIPEIDTQSDIPAWYARVSTGRQENEETIDSQIDEIEQRIKTDGLVLDKENTFSDDGWTGTILQRPGVDQMLEAAKAGKFSILYVYDLGRLARKYHYQRLLIEELEEYGVKVISLYDRKVESDEDQVMQGIEGLFHEYERLKIFRRFQRGKLYKAKQGVIINGQPLYGYKRSKKTEDNPAQYSINDKEAPAVRKIFDWFDQGLSIHKIVQRLHEEDVPPRKQKQEYWTKGPLRRILTCETYLTGVAHYNKSKAVPPKNPRIESKYRKIKNSSRVERPKDEWIPFEVPTILNRPGDKEIFARAQKKLAKNKKYAKKKRPHDYLITGLVWCECGLRRAGDGGSRHGHHYYRCTGRMQTRSKYQSCKSDGVNADVLDADLWDRFKKYLRKPNNLKTYARRWIEHQQKQAAAHVSGKDKIEEELQQINLERDRYAQAYGSGTFNLEQLQRYTENTKRREQALKTRLKQIENKTKAGKPQQKDIDLLCKEAKLNLRSLDLKDRKRVIENIIEKVIIYGANKVEVWGHLPINTERLGSYAESRNSRVA